MANKKIRIICGVYKIVSPAGRIYIGQSRHILKRLNDYRRGKCKAQTRLYRSISKYGWDSHTVEVLEECDVSELSSREQYYISLCDSFNTDKGLNLRSGGTVNSIVSSETLEKMRVCKKNISGIAKMGAASHNARRVLQYDLNGCLVKVWSCIMDIERDFGFNHTNISKSCKGKCYSAYGYLWGYEDEARTFSAKQNGFNRRRKIYQYGLDGFFIKEWSGLPEVRGVFGNDVAGITSACKGRYQMAYGYMWRYAQYPKIEPYVDSKKYIPVVQHSKNGDLINEWGSISEASKHTGVNETQISACAKNKPKFKTAGGFIWKFKQVA